MKNYRHHAWAFIIFNLDIQFPPGPTTPELIWILKELGGHSDADIISMASNRHVFAKSITGISYAEAMSIKAQEGQCSSGMLSGCMEPVEEDPNNSLQPENDHPWIE
eukprot:9823332-Heterocapsa_arctica.AAC.1